MDYFINDEKQQMLSLVHELLVRLGDQVSARDVARVRQLITTGIEAGLMARDRYGFNPVVRHLRTAALTAQLVAPDRNMTIATLLYNLCKKGHVSQATIARDFGDDTASLVCGLLNVARLYTKKSDVENDNYHKLLLSFAHDIRVIIIMIVDRLALMRVINHHPDAQLVHNIATESRYLYAPLAHRLGLYAIKGELEDTSLKYLNRKVYTQIAEKLNETKVMRDQYVADFIRPIREALDQSGLKYEIKGRTKSINSIWNKMCKKDVDLNGMYDLFAIRIILDSTRENEKKECWIAYSIVTDIYMANTSRFKDWITVPKSNGYESLHITVKGPGDKWVEVQIRTTRMDEIAERGLAAHWKYKGIKSEGNLDVWMNNVREVLETGSEGQMQILKNMNMNPYDKDIFVFTPRGDLFKLPNGATVLDFAFHIHSRLGCQCIGGRVDGKNQKLNYQLKSGDTVEVMTSSTQTPRLDWLNFVVTSKARSKIKQAVNEARVKQADLAREALQRRFKNRKIEVDDPTLSRLIKKMGYKTITDFYVAIQEGALDINDVIEQYLAQVARNDEATAPQHGAAEEFVLQNTIHEQSASSDILVIDNDVKGLNYKLSKCCNPIYGDKIVGFIASDGAIKVHRADCGNVRHLMSKYPYRIITTRWSGKIGAQLAATLKVVGRDDIGIVATITSVINKMGDTQLRSISIQSQGDMFEGFLTIGVSSTAMLDELIKKLLTVKGVKGVERI